MKWNSFLFLSLTILMCTKEMIKNLLLAFKEERGTILLNYTS